MGSAVNFIVESTDDLIDEPYQTNCKPTDEKPGKYVEQESHNLSALSNTPQI